MDLMRRAVETREFDERWRMRKSGQEVLCELRGFFILQIRVFTGTLM